MKKFINGLLDNISSKGRYGDTTLRNVGGEISHVNTKEAHAIDTYGLLGEYATQLIGAGTINPSTGLREYHQGGMAKEGYNRHYHELQSDSSYIEKTIGAGHPNFDDAYYTKTTHYESDAKIQDPSQYAQFQADFRFDTLEEKDPDPYELSKYIDPETGEIREGQQDAFVAYIRTLNPKFREYATMGSGHEYTDADGNKQQTYKQRVDADGQPYYNISDKDVLREFMESGISPFKDPYDYEQLTEGYMSTAEGLRDAAKEAGLASQKTGGSVYRPGQYGFGGREQTISDSLSKDILKEHSAYTSNIYDLETDKLEEFGTFTRGLTQEDGALYDYSSEYKPIT